MNTIFSCRNIFGVLGLTAVSVLVGGLSANAQTTGSPNQQLPQSSKFTTQNVQEYPNQFPSITTQTVSRVITPVPGTSATSSAALIQQYPTKTYPQKSQKSTSTVKVAQSDIDLGTPTRGGSSYVGIAANIGLDGGNSSLGDGNFAVISKIGVTNKISVRPAAVFGNNTTVLLPITYDFVPLRASDPFAEPLAISPYVGVGAAIDTGNKSQVAFLVSGGVDVPLNPQFTATAAVNAGFFDQTSVGLMLGVGYNFSGL